MNTEYHHFLLHDGRFVAVGTWEIVPATQPPMDPLLKMAIELDPDYEANPFVVQGDMRHIYRIMVIDKLNGTYHGVQSAKVHEADDLEVQHATWALAGRGCRVRWGFGREEKE